MEAQQTFSCGLIHGFSFLMDSPEQGDTNHDLTSYEIDPSEKEDLDDPWGCLIDVGGEG